MMRLLRDRQFCFSATRQAVLRRKALDYLSWDCISFRTGRKTNKIQRTNLFPWIIFEQALLEGSAFLFPYSSTSRTLLKSSWWGEIKCAISAGQDVKLKNKSLRKGKKTDIALRAQMVIVVWAAEPIDICISMQLPNPYTVRTLSIGWVEICNFRRIGWKTEKYKPSKGQKLTLHHKHISSLFVWAANRIEMNISIQLHRLYTVQKVSIRWAKICNFSEIGHKIKK